MRAPVNGLPAALVSRPDATIAAPFAGAVFESLSDSLGTRS